MDVNRYLDRWRDRAIRRIELHTAAVRVRTGVRDRYARQRLSAMIEGRRHIRHEQQEG